MIELVEQYRDRLKSLCIRYDVTRFDVIGSAARGDFREADSDLDFVVQFSHLHPGNAADRYFGMLASLEDLFGRPIDLISYTAIRNPYFKQIVDQTRVQLYAA